MGIDSNERDAMHGYNNPSSEKAVKLKSTSSTVLNISKVFLYVFIGLLITTIVAMGVGIGLNQLLLKDAAAYNGTVTGIMVGVAIALIIDVIVMNFVTLKGNHSIVGPAVIYAILVGLLFSTFVVWIPWEILGTAFGITCLTFVLMGLIAFLTKDNLSPLLIGAFGLLGGAGILALINFIIMLINPVLATPLFWIITFAMFAFFMLVTVFDLWNMKKIAERGEMSNNITLYCAFSLYVDFINIFLRILYFLLIIFGRRR